MRRRKLNQRIIHHRTSGGQPDTLPWRPLRRPTRTGITRSPRPRTAPNLPPTERQLEVLALLGPEPVRAAELGRLLGRPAHGVNSNLYSLADRGLAIRAPGKGWKRL